MQGPVSIEELPPFDLCRLLPVQMMTEGIQKRRVLHRAALKSCLFRDLRVDPSVFRSNSTAAGLTPGVGVKFLLQQLVRSGTSNSNFKRWWWDPVSHFKESVPAALPVPLISVTLSIPSSVCFGSGFLTRSNLRQTDSNAGPTSFA